ncbi:unnamed protein product [Larinioides sclopetarius]|uniref:Uncharacterized protein n=1 Tax=Larinioides sclopetarius TaxID=280406 RepID=A0AAV1Z8S1_9ARAC
MSYPPTGFNESSTVMTYASSPVTIGPFIRYNRSMNLGGRLPPPKPTDGKYKLLDLESKIRDPSLTTCEECLLKEWYCDSLIKQYSAVTPNSERQVVTDPKRMLAPESSFKEMHHYPHTDCMPQEKRKANRCSNCHSIPTVFCYTCCQCGCRPSIPTDVNLGMPAFREINQMGCCKQCQCSTCPADRGRSSCKKCNCSNCPTDADPYCKCKCRSKQISLDARPIVIPILSCVLCFPVLAFAIICALRYRAIRLRKKDRLKRVKSGCRSVTLEIPARDKSSFYSKDSSSDPSLKGLGEVSQAVPESPPLLMAPSTSGTSSRRSSKSNQHVKFMTTTAVFHGRTITGLNGRFKSTGKKQKIFWDEHSSHVECAQELEKELSLALNS